MGVAYAIIKAIYHAADMKQAERNHILSKMKERIESQPPKTYSELGRWLEGEGICLGKSTLYNYVHKLSLQQISKPRIPTHIETALKKRLLEVGFRSYAQMQAWLRLQHKFNIRLSVLRAYVYRQGLRCHVHSHYRKPRLNALTNLLGTRRRTSMVSSIIKHINHTTP